MDEKKIGELQEGMITMKEVYRENRQVLFARRTIITREVMASLAAHHIESVCVSEDISYVAKFREINERVDRKFSAYGNNPLMQHIAEVARKYFKERVVKSFG